MSGRWPDKYVIGLTGNIATGKSMVRKMLEHLGAFGIDADGLAARATAKGAPAHQPVVDTFGKWLVDDNGEINRQALGGIVFSDPEALAKLEAIVHPVVGVAVDALVKRANQQVVVIEAIKLLESGLGDDCDEIWVVDTAPELQRERLVEKRDLSEDDANLRMTAQPPQSLKVARADYVVENSGTFAEPWAQVQQGWAAIMATLAEAESDEEEPAEEVEAAAVAEAPAASVPDVAPATTVLGELIVERGGPDDAALIAEFIGEVSMDGKELTAEAVMLAFGQKAYFLALSDGNVVGLAGWQVENLITTVDEFYLRTDVPAPRVIAMLVEQIEQASADLQSEVSLLFISTSMPDEAVQVFIDAGYEHSRPEDVKVAMWRDAAIDLQPPNTRLLTKRLREDRVLKPI